VSSETWSGRSGRIYPIGRGKWEVWIVLTRGGERVGEKHLSSHRTHLGAERRARDINGDPSILAHTMLRMAETGERGVFADAEVRNRAVRA
jgi:hypothetical protein